MGSIFFSSPKGCETIHIIESMTKSGHWRSFWHARTRLTPLLWCA